MLKVTYELVHLPCLFFHLSSTFPDSFKDRHNSSQFFISTGSWERQAVVGAAATTHSPSPAGSSSLQSAWP